MSHILNGSTTPSRIFTYTIEQLCKPPFSLRAIHENSLRERADQLWVAAEKEEDLGGLIKACRIRLGENMETFAKRIGKIAGKKEGFGTRMTSFFWEDNKNLPTGGHHKTGETLYKPMVRAMKLADHAPNGLSRSIQTPWFDTAKEKTFHQIFTRAVQKANEGHFTSELPSTEPIDTPDYHSIDPRLCVHVGKLSNQILNEHKSPN